MGSHQPTTVVHRSVSLTGFSRLRSCSLSGGRSIRLNPLMGAQELDVPQSVHTKPRKKRDLVGGADSIMDFVETWIRGHPITSAQIGIGVGLNLLHNMGILRYGRYLFHPRLFFRNLWRSITNVLPFETGLLGVVLRSLTMLCYHGEVEERLNGRGDIVRNGQVLAVGEQRVKGDGTRKTLLQWLFTDNKFLKYQILSMSIIAPLEAICYLFGLGSNPVDRNCGRYTTINGSKAPPLILTYSLFPILQSSVCWMWALTRAGSGNANILGEVETTILLKLVTGELSERDRDALLRAMNLYNAENLAALLRAISRALLTATPFLELLVIPKTSLKGLITCLIVCRIMDIRRDDGEPVWEYAKRNFMRLKTAVARRSTKQAPRPLFKND